MKIKGNENNTSNKQSEQIKQIGQIENVQFRDNLKVRNVELDSNYLNQYYYDNFMKDEIITDSSNM